jgi:adenosylcobinamide-phosphate synthase
MGRLITLVEKWVRRFCVESGSLRLTGVALALGLPSLAFCAGWAVMATGTALHDGIGRGIGIWLASTVLAWRDLVDHVRAVSRALKAGTLEGARHSVGLIVGRDTDRLSEREIAVLRLICEQLSTKEIASVLNLSVRTIESHREHIQQKTGSRNLVGMVIYAIKHGIFEIKD